MIIDTENLPGHQVYPVMTSCITPRPIAWVSSISTEGIPNLAPFSYFNGVGSNPPAIMFAPVNRRDGTKKDTLINIEATQEFVVNIVSFSQTEAMNQTSAEFAPEVNEFERCGLTQAPADRVKPPRVKEALVHLECALEKIVPIGDGPLAGNVIIGRVLLIHVDDSVVDAEGKIDPEKLDTIGRMGQSTYVRTTERFDMERPPRK